jgi:hypothetical protein
MELFDIVKLIFNKKDAEWKNVGKNDKTRNFFMINRIMAINFPIQANQFNKIKITPAPVVDWWRDTLSPKYTRTPQWIFTKTKKKDSEKDKEQKKNFDVAEDFIRDRYRISKRDLLQLKTFYPQKYEKWVIDISEQIGIQTKNI